MKNRSFGREINGTLQLMLFLRIVELQDFVYIEFKSLSETLLCFHPNSLINLCSGRVNQNIS